MNSTTNKGNYTPPMVDVLQLLDQLMVYTLVDRLIRNWDSIPWCDDMKNPQPILEDIETTWNRGVTARVPMFYNTRWCDEFAHGSDVIFPITKLAGKILQNGEVIEETTTKFRKPITSDLQIIVQDVSAEDGGATQKSEICIEGTLITNHDRTLRFIWVPTRQKINEFRYENPILKDIIHDMETTSQWLSFNLDESALARIQNSAPINTPFFISSMYELATKIGVAVLMKWLHENNKTADVKMVTAVEMPNQINDESTTKKVLWVIKEVTHMEGRFSRMTIEINVPFFQKPIILQIAFK